MPGWHHDMVELADFAYGRLRTRLVGLTDDEYFWEPAPACWSVRRDEDGACRGDWASPVWPPPFTTIAWRLGHIVANLNDRRYATHLGLDPQGDPTETLPCSAAEALVRLDDGYQVTRGYLTALTDGDLAETLGPVAGPWAEGDRGSFVLHMLDELIHHAAEVAVLRDLYRATREPNPAVEALLAGDPAAVDAATSDNPDAVGRALAERADLLVQAAAESRWTAVPVLVAAGFALDLPDGSSALHYAAAAGRLDTVRLLLDAGADPALRDPLYRATPIEWADYFNQPETAAYLRTHST